MGLRADVLVGFIGFGRVLRADEDVGGPMKAIITNALIRCTRDDRCAESAFELVREDLGLWVCELPECLEDVVAELSAMQPLLRELSLGGTDFTLHLAATVDSLHALTLPPDLTALSGDCGFSIEVIASPE